MNGTRPGEDPFEDMTDHDLQRVKSHAKKALDRLEAAEMYFPDDYDLDAAAGEAGFALDFTAAKARLDSVLHEVVKAKRRRR